MIKRGGKHYQKHPNFDEYWNNHHKFVFNQSEKLAKKLKINYKELLGPMTLKFNACLYSYSPNKGTKFTTYFSQFIIGYLVRCIINDFEYKKLNYFVLKNKNYNNKIESNLDLELLSEKETQIIWIDLFYKSFYGKDNFWNYLTNSLADRDKLIIERLREGINTGKLNPEEQKIFKVKDIKTIKCLMIKKLKNKIKQDPLFSEFIGSN